MFGRTHLQTSTPYSLDKKEEIKKQNFKRSKQINNFSIWNRLYLFKHIALIVVLNKIFYCSEVLDRLNIRVSIFHFLPTDNLQYTFHSF